VEATRAALGLAQIHNVHHTDRILADAHAALKAPAFARAWAAGHRVSLEEAVGEVLTVANEVLAQGKG
jgi:hypothetical protein